MSVLGQSLSLLRSILTILLTCPNSDTLLCYGNNTFLTVWIVPIYVSLSADIQIYIRYSTCMYHTFTCTCMYTAQMEHKNNQNLHLGCKLTLVGMKEVIFIRPPPPACDTGIPDKGCSWLERMGGFAIPSDQG